MESVKVEMEMPKECYELGLGVAKLLKEVKKAGADGWQLGQDVPQVVLASLQDVMRAVDGLEKLPEEFKQVPVSSVLAVVSPVMDAVVEMIKK